MDTQSATSFNFRILSLLGAFSVAVFFLISLSLPHTSAGTQERVFENTIPKDVPIKLKIKKEKEQSFKDLKNEKWLREFELQLTNVGEKPIYFLYMDLITDVKIGGDPLEFSVVYGRPELGDIVGLSKPEDVPIKPGETYIFTIYPAQVPAWEYSVRKGNHPQATRIRAKLEALSFGDGTGYFGDRPYPPSSRQQSLLDKRILPPNKGHTLLGNKAVQTKTKSIVNMPASFLPAYFLFSRSSSSNPAASIALPEDGCLFEYCVGVIPSPPVYVCYNCQLQNRPTPDRTGSTACR
jgi:hypothetical protein